MAHVVKQNGLTAVIATTIDGEEMTLAYRSDQPSIYECMPGVCGPAITGLLDIANTSFDGARTLVRFHQDMGQERFRDSIDDICQAFSDAGFAVPTVRRLAMKGTQKLCALVQPPRNLAA